MSDKFISVPIDGEWAAGISNLPEPDWDQLNKTLIHASYWLNANTDHAVSSGVDVLLFALNDFRSRDAGL